MRIIETASGIEKIKKGCVLTIGNFDGVHIGHTEILTAAKQAALQRQTDLVVMTFEPHPVAILYPQKAPKVLTPLKLKEHLLAEFGVDCLIVLKDSAELLKLSPTDFVDRFLVNGIDPGIVVEGENFNFGFGRAGNVYTLRNLGLQKGFEVSIIEAKAARFSIGQAVKVSSTLIRNMLTTDKVADAAIALGRPYRLVGRVVTGRGKGKQLGFPTLNMDQPNQIVPAEGVYAGFVEIADSEEKLFSAKQKIPAVFSIGRSQSFSSSYPLAIEAHILSGDVDDSAGKWIAMDFAEHIRSQQKFETEKELTEQIAKDCKKAKNILGMN